MQESTTREKVLKRIRKAVIHKTNHPNSSLDFETSVFTKSENPIEIEFAENLTQAGGSFVFCESHLEVVESLISLAQSRGLKNIVVPEESIQQILSSLEFPYSKNGEEGIDVLITGCEALSARTGTVVMSSRQQSGRKLLSFAPIHIVIANTSQLVSDVKDALALIKNRYEENPSMITFVSGPSRTADIEKKLIYGAHGPKELFVFLIEEPNLNLI